MTGESAASLHVGAGGGVDAALVFVLALGACVGAVAVGPGIAWRSASAIATSAASSGSSTVSMASSMSLSSTAATLGLVLVVDLCWELEQSGG